MAFALSAHHVHECKQWLEEGRCESLPCRCSCGATLVMGPKFAQDGLWYWQDTAGRYYKFPHRGEAAVEL